ncbi:MAG: glutathione peroxidase [Ferruginibacter sp.]
MKYFFYFSIVLFISFCIYVIIVNRNSKQMTLKQKILKAVYPQLMWFSKKNAKTLAPSSNQNTISPVSFYSLEGELISGKPFGFDQLKGKKILLVNTASDCGYTRQYEDLQKLQQQFENKLVIIGFPSNEFSEQEKADNSSIEKFCKINYGVSFPLMKKSNVKKSDDQNKVYKWLTDATQNGWNDKQPEWNFSKYLIDENGKLVDYFTPAVSPLDSVVLKAIEN